mgnify:CR=1 FL=1
MPWQQNNNKELPPVELLDESEMRELAPPGSVTGNQDADAAGLDASPRRRFKDVPLPAGLREDFEQTYVFENANVQVGRMVYYSKASVTEIAQFYINACPESGWTLDSVLRAEGGANLDFRKPGKRLIVWVQAQGVGRSQKLVLHLTPEE